MNKNGGNVLRLLGVQAQENAITNLLSHCLISSRSFRLAFLNSVCGIDGQDFSSVEASTQISIPGVGVLDLVLVCRGERDCLVVIVENKLKAKEGKRQTVRYSSPKCRDGLAKRFRLEAGDCKWKNVFLTLFPDAPSPEGGFVTATYHDLLSELSPGVGQEEPVAEQLLQDWRQILSEFYERARVHENDVVTEKLKDSSGLEGGYLYFRKLIDSLRLPEGLEVGKFFKESRPGRRYYGANIRRPTWKPARMREINGKYRIDPYKNFDIHLEPQFNPLNGPFALYLHYEINPYRSVAWMRKYADPSDYSNFLGVRKQFAERLKARHIDDLRVYINDKWTNMIGKWQYDVTGHTVADVRKRLEGVVGTVTENVDSLLGEIGLG